LLRKRRPVFLNRSIPLTRIDPLRGSIRPLPAGARYGYRGLAAEAYNAAWP
jgi:hypothetical protein